MTHHAKGPFDVKLSPQEPSGPAAAAGIGRMAIDKQFHGDLEATSQGEMVAFMTSIKTSAGYVALEKVTGTLRGRSGSFVLQHSGIATAAAQDLTITVVPDSGSGELAGLSGRMTISIAEGGKHSYDFEYSLPKTN